LSELQPQRRLFFGPHRIKLAEPLQEALHHRVGLIQSLLNFSEPPEIIQRLRRHCAHQARDGSAQGVLFVSELNPA
jgi:hypothetical protein